MNAVTFHLPSVRRFLVLAWLASLVSVLGFGCGSGAKSEADLKLPATPAEAAAQVEEVFATSEPVAKENAAAAAEAVRTGNYEKAVVALQSLKARPEATLNEGLAVHGYLVTLEAKLINDAAAGDEKAQRAYELLRKMKRK